MKKIKPLFINDVDGTIVSFPVERVWIGGDERIRSMYDPALHDPKNWEFRTLKYDPLLHFIPDHDIMATIKELDGNTRDVTLRWSSELTNNIKDLIDSGAIDYRWLTHWRDNVNTQINPRLGISNDLAPYIPWSPRFNDSGEAGKYFGLMRYLEENDVPTGTPLIWIDDVATRGHQGLFNDPKDSEDDEDDYKSPYLMDDDDDEKRLEDYPRLIIKTDIEWGITRKDYADIEAFIKYHS